MKLIVEGDRHIQSKQPFYDAHMAYNEWLLSQPFNSPSTVFFSQGDFFNKANPDPHEYALAVDFIERAEFDRIIIQAGNHEYNRPNDRYALHPLEHFEKVEVLYKETAFSIENTSFLSLPFFYPNKRNVGRMEDYYPTLPQYPVGQDHFDYLFGHLYFVDTYGSYVDVSKINADRKIFGHDHIQFSNRIGEYIGTPMPHRYTEKGQQGHLILIDCLDATEQYVDVPKIIDYETVTYPDPLPKTDVQYMIWDVEEAPDRSVAIDHYRKQDPNFTYREVRIKKPELSTETGDEGSEKEAWSINDWLENYLKETERSEEVAKIVREKMQQK